MPANLSKAVKRELELASHYDKPFIPIRIDGVEPAAGLDYYLRNTQWTDYGRDGEQALDGIVALWQGASPPGLAASPPAAGISRARRRTALVLIMVGARSVSWPRGGWFSLDRRGRAGYDRGAVRGRAPGAQQLAGSYHWERCRLRGRSDGDAGSRRARVHDAGKRRPTATR